MSNPKRYEPSTQCVEPSYQAQMIEPIVREVAWGNYVRYKDYARLKAEVDKLKANDSIIIEAQASAGKSVVVYLAEIDSLKAEVERLTKAGDAMAKVIDADATAWFERVVRDWNKAKGVQS